MGKSLIQQKRGKGSTSYRKPSFRFKGRSCITKGGEATITKLFRCQAHTAPMATLQYSDRSQDMIIAPEGVRIGDKVTITDHHQKNHPIATGNAIPLANIPEGTSIHNIELRAGDGGKFCRSGGAAARIITKQDDKVIVQLPSKKKRAFKPTCRATIGIVAGSGRLEKPLLKAGIAFHKAKAKNTRYPKIRGAAQNAVNHPFGNKRTSRKAHAKPAPKNAPPGRKVGMIRPRQSGRKRGKQ